MQKKYDLNIQIFQNTAILTWFAGPGQQTCIKMVQNWRAYPGYLVHSSTGTTRIYAVPSVEMMRQAMELGNMTTDEKPLWPDDEAKMARICGLR